MAGRARLLPVWGSKKLRRNLTEPERICGSMASCPWMIMLSPLGHPLSYHGHILEEVEGARPIWVPLCSGHYHPAPLASLQSLHVASVLTRSGWLGRTAEYISVSASTVSGLALLLCHLLVDRTLEPVTQFLCPSICLYLWGLTE